MSQKMDWTTIKNSISAISFSGTASKTYTPNFVGFVCVAGYLSRPAKSSNSHITVEVKVGTTTLFSEDSDVANPTYSNWRVRNFSYTIPAIPNQTITVECKEGADGTLLTTEKFMATAWKIA